MASVDVYSMVVASVDVRIRPMVVVSVNVYGMVAVSVHAYSMMASVNVYRMVFSDLPLRSTRAYIEH